MLVPPTLGAFLDLNIYSVLILTASIPLAAFEAELTGVATIQSRFISLSAVGPIGILANCVVFYLSCKGIYATHSLALGATACSLARTAFLAISTRTLPTPPTPKALLLLPRNFGFISTTGLTKALGGLANDLPFWAIGFLYTKVDLGLFARGQRLAQIPQDVFQAAAGGLAPGIFNRHKADSTTLRSSYQRMLAVCLIVSTTIIPPTLITLKLILPRILREDWTPLVAITSILMLAGYFRNSLKLSDTLLRATGRTRPQLVATIAYPLATVALVGLGRVAEVSQVTTGLLLALGSIVWWHLLSKSAADATGETLSRSILNAWALLDRRSRFATVLSTGITILVSIRPAKDFELVVTLITTTIVTLFSIKSLGKLLDPQSAAKPPNLPEDCVS